MNSCSQVVIELLLAKAYHLPDVVSDITNVSVHIQFNTATFQTDHIGKVIAAASAFSCCQFLRALMSWPCGWEAYMRGRVVGEVREFSRQAYLSSSRLCPTVSCRVCCCFEEGLWEVLALRGQLRTPPSSCFDRHQALTQTFSLFHSICGFSNGSLHRSYKTGVALCECSVKVRLVCHCYVQHEKYFEFIQSQGLITYSVMNKLLNFLT